MRKISEVFRLPEVDPEAIAEVSTLLSPQLREGRGDAFVLLSPSGDDLAFVLVSGLTNVRDVQLPLEVRLVGNGSRQLVVGKIRTLDSGGEGGVYRPFGEPLSGIQRRRDQGRAWHGAAARHIERLRADVLTILAGCASG